MEEEYLLSEYFGSLISKFTEETVEILRIFAKQKASDLKTGIETDEIQIRLKLKQTKANEILRFLISTNLITYDLNGKKRMYYVTDYGKIIFSMLFKK